jgi:membrane-bound metal-dependent hydrolase YbcI (DUF457 family)
MVASAIGGLAFQMMGRTHVRFGAVLALGAAAAVSQVAGVLYAPDVLLAVCEASGFALLPDIDSRTALATKAFPPVTLPLHHIVTWIHRMIYAATRRAHDEPSRLNGRFKPRVKQVFGSTRIATTVFGVSRGWRSAHRGITHSLITAFVCSAGMVGLSYLSPWIPVVIILAGVLLGGALVFALPILGIYLIAALVSFGYEGILPHLVDTAPLWGSAMFIGLASHDLGDGCTTHGAPLWAPITWEDYRAPLHFGTNDWFEKNVLKWIFYVMMAYFIGVLLSTWYPDLLPAILRLVVGLLSGFTG